MPLNLERADPSAVEAEQAAAAKQDAEKDYSQSSPDDLPGHWNGLVQVQKLQVRIIIHIARLPDGSLSTTMEIPERASGEIPAITTQYTPPIVQIVSKVIGCAFNGTLKKGELTGTCRFGRSSSLVVLTRD